MSVESEVEVMDQRQSVICLVYRMLSRADSSVFRRAIAQRERCVVYALQRRDSALPLDDGCVLVITPAGLKVAKQCAGLWSIDC